MAARMTSSGAGASAARRSRELREAHRRERHKVLIRRSPLFVAAGVAVGWLTAAGTGSARFGALLGAVVLLALAGLTHKPRSQSADRWAKGAEGERRTARALESARGWTALHDRAIPGSRANLDHLLIGPPGVVYLDTKNWSNSRSRARFEGGRLWYGRYPQDRTLRTVRWEADQARAVLGVPVRPVIAVHGQPHLPHSGTMVDGVVVIPAEALRSWLRAQPGRLGRDQVTALAARARAALPPYAG